MLALPAELLVQVLVQLAGAGDLARVAMACAAFNTAMEHAVAARAQRRGLRIANPRPFLQITPWVRHIAGWSFVLRAAEVRPCVLMGMDQNAARGDREWLWQARNNGDAPTKWCIENERHERIAEDLRVQAQAAAEQAARMAAEKLNAKSCAISRSGLTSRLASRLAWRLCACEFTSQRTRVSRVTAMDRLRKRHCRF